MGKAAIRGGCSGGGGSGAPGALHHQQQQHTQQQLAHKAQQALRDKVQAAAEAQHAAGLGAGQGPERQDRQSLAVGMLVEGRPQAFIDFFELTAEAGPAPSAPGAPGGASAPAPDAEQRQQLPQAGLLLLRDQLVRADATEKAADARSAYDAHKQLGRYFTGLMQLDRAAMFYGRCRQAARDSRWLEGELESSCALGLVYERLRRADEAVECHERCLELALLLAGPAGSGGGGADEERAAADTAAVRVEEARRTLVHVYAQQAEQREKAGDLAAAAAFLHKCLEAAEHCADAAAAGAASHRLGLLCAAQGRWHEAADHQAVYVQRSKQAGDAVAESAACRAYAECLRRLGDLEGAMAALESYLGLCEAMHDGDTRGPALVSCQLGCLHYQRGELAAAVACFERFFELARSLDARLLDAARANLGAARGALQLREYMGVAAGDLPRLLRVKGLQGGLG